MPKYPDLVFADTSLSETQPSNLIILSMSLKQVSLSWVAAFLIGYHQFSFYLEYEIFFQSGLQFALQGWFSSGCSAPGLPFTPPWLRGHWPWVSREPHSSDHGQKRVDHHAEFICREVDGAALQAIWRTNCFLCQQRWQTRDCHCLTLFSTHNIWGTAVSLLSYSCGFCCALVWPSNLTVLQHSILFDLFLLS